MTSIQESTIAQASAVPYRIRKGKTELCLVTSIRKGRWGFPKGMIDPGDTTKETALKETLEEAGVHGVIEGKSLGKYRYRKFDREFEVTGLLMRVTKVDDVWEEVDLRERKWCGIDEARDLITRNGVLKLLEAAWKMIQSS